MHSNIYDMNISEIKLSKSAENNRGRGIERRTINNQAQLFHELELLWNENFQLLLRVYNAQQRVDRLLSVAALGRDRNTSNGIDTGSESTDTDSDNTVTDSESTDTDSDSADTDSADADCSRSHAESGTGQNNAAAKATAEVAVRTIHDLNRRLMALMAATVSDKSATPLETVIEEDEGVGSEVTCLGSEVTRLRRQCRQLRPVQQLMKTEPWARNKKFCELEQQRCMTQVTNASSGCAGSGIGQNNAAAKATTEAAVRTIHDLLTLNRRLAAFMAATVSDKSVSVSTVNKRRWQELRSRIEEYAVDGPNKEKTNEDEDHGDENDGEFYDASAIDSETFYKARILSTEGSVTVQNVLRSPSPSTPLQTVSKEDEGVASDVTRLWGQFRPIRSVEQLMKTELWAQNQKYFGKLEQKRFMTQVAYAGDPRDRRPPEQALAAAIVVPPQRHRLQEFRLKAATSTKRILVIQSATKAPEATCTESLTAAASLPPGLPDYSEVDFFFSCAEEDDDDDDYDRQEDVAEINCTSSSEKETADWTDCRSDEETVWLAAIGAPVASSMRSRMRMRPHHRQPHPPIKGDGDSATTTMTTSSSTDSAAAEDEADELNGDGVITTKTIVTARRNGSASVGSGSIKRRRGIRPRRCLSGGVDAAAEPANRLRPPSMADVQVQFGEENVVVDDLSGCRETDDELQLLRLRRELDAQRRENGRLNDMLLRLQRGMRPGDQGKGDSSPSVPFPDSDPSDSPEPSRLAFGAVRGLIAKQFSPLLSAQQISDDDDDVDGGDGEHQRYRQDGVEQRMQLLVYKRRELDGVDDGSVAAVLQQSWPEDSLNEVIRRMDHTGLVNVGLPLVVGRLRRALVMLQHRPENVTAK